VIAILSALAVITYGGMRKDSRDATRASNAVVISPALEKYYDKNGEYPSVASLINTNPGNTGASVASKLSISPDILKMPLMPKTATNSLTAGPTPISDYMVYIGLSTANNAQCQSDINGGCDQFTLKYLEESGATKVIESQHRG
jgi:type II secretory pathway pseudopilin PulG